MDLLPLIHSDQDFVSGQELTFPSTWFRSLNITWSPLTLRFPVEFSILTYTVTGALAQVWMAT